MTVLQIKTDLHQLIEDVSDIRILNAIKILLTQPSAQADPDDFWDGLPDSVKRGIDAALECADNEETLPHKDVMGYLKSKYYKRNEC